MNKNVYGVFVSNQETPFVKGEYLSMIRLAKAHHQKNNVVTYVKANTIDINENWITLKKYPNKKG